MRLVSSLRGQGYHVYFDNFYSTVQLAEDLRNQDTLCCGTLLTNRKGVPLSFKDSKAFAKNRRGEVRWKTQGNVVFLQCLDNKPVTLISTVHTKANLSGFVKRRTKVQGRYRPIHVRQPKVVDDYNINMSGVDRSDQPINKYETLRKTNRWWKTLFFHFLDVAKVNSYILLTGDKRTRTSKNSSDLQHSVS
ncbi:hypothetical protein BaRGS_00004442 [Batillaria attramentaria]|uniref:PiggyBac transposable element-derived protein domain-containing protein n=1 Tax=Batillaria attramentaria TaxID=370345 RepID=A0ABD0LYP3_9CAEN